MWLLFLLRSWPARRRLRDSISGAVSRQGQPGAREQVRVEGPQPLLVLIIGSGLAVGHGMSERSAALDGHLARQLASRTGRGVRITNLATNAGRLSDQIVAAGDSATLDLQDVVVWSPSVLEMCRSRLPRSWRSQLGELLRHVSAGRRVVVLALPHTTGEGPLVALNQRLAETTNEQLRRAVAGFGNVSLVDPPPIHIPAAGRPQLTGDFYAALGRRITAAVEGPVRTAAPLQR